MPPRRSNRQPPARPDILHLAQENLGTADQVTVFGALFDAAIRSTWTVRLTDVRRTAVLCGAVDRLMEEIERKVPVQVGAILVIVAASRAAGRVMKPPALKP